MLFFFSQCMILCLDNHSFIQHFWGHLQYARHCSVPTTEDITVNKIGEYPAHITHNFVEKGRKYSK